MKLLENISKSSTLSSRELMKALGSWSGVSDVQNGGNMLESSQVLESLLIEGKPHSTSHPERGFAGMLIGYNHHQHHHPAIGCPLELLVGR